MTEINRSRGRLVGKGMAITGIVTGSVAIFVAIMIAHQLGPTRGFPVVRFRAGLPAP
jgi:hypothetical protein